GSAVGGVVCGIRACRRPLLVRDDRTRRRELCGAARRGDAAGAAGDRMTAPATPATPRRLTRRGTTLILAALGAALVITVLLAPEDVALRGPGGTSTYDDSPTGARLLYLLVGRLGWVAERRDSALAGPPDSTTIEAVLAPAIPLSASDAHLLLDGVRAGAGLLYVAGGGDGLADSLHIARTDAGTFSSGISISSCHDVHTSPGIPLWPRNV